jgi:hypothetical protein
MNFTLRKLLIGLAAAATGVCLVSRWWDPAWELQHGPLESIAGVYWFGDGLAMNHALEIRPAGRFKFRSSG